MAKACVNYSPFLTPGSLYRINSLYGIEVFPIILKNPGFIIPFGSIVMFVEVILYDNFCEDGHWIRVFYKNQFNEIHLSQQNNLDLVL